jgi:hypothetical protein
VFGAQLPACRCASMQTMSACLANTRLTVFVSACLPVHLLLLLSPPPCVCRSDSNGEDLEGYAGAGLYESITMDETQLVRVDYNDDPITCDPEFRRKVRHRDHLFSKNYVTITCLKCDAWLAGLLHTVEGRGV